LIGGCFFVISAAEFASRQDAVSEALAQAVERQIAAIERTVRRASKGGELEIVTSPSQTAFGLFSLLVNSDALFHLREDPIVFDRARVAIGEFLDQRGDARVHPDRPEAAAAEDSALPSYARVDR